MSPTSSIHLGAKYDRGFWLSEYDIAKSIVAESGLATVKALSVETGISVEQEEAALLSLGYRAAGSTTVMVGHVSRANPIRAGKVVEVEIQDDRPLRLATTSLSDVDASVEDLVRSLVESAGMAVGALDLSEATLKTKTPKTRRKKARTDTKVLGNVYLEGRVEHTVSQERPVIEVLRTLKDRLHYPYPWHIGTDGKFYWTPWDYDAADAEDKFVFTYQVNIVDLSQVERDDLEQAPLDESGAYDPYRDYPRWELAVVPNPWVRAGALVLVEHPKLRGGEKTPLRVDTVRYTRRPGETRTLLSLREVN